MALAPNGNGNGNDAAPVGTSPQGDAAVPPPTRGTSAGGAVVIGTYFRIYPNTPLPALNSPTAKAFAAEDSRQPNRKLFALICMPGLPPRTDAMALLKGSSFANLLPLVEWDVVDWPPAGRRAMAVVFERPMGGRVMDVIAKTGKRIKEHDVARVVIEPLLTMIRDLTARGVPHRNIRADNLFYMDERREKIMVGECVTTPPGYDQPMVYETIERGLAHPAGRGAGNFTDDYYAFGVTLVLLVAGASEFEGMNDTDILLAKIEHGTYNTLVGKERVPVNILEPLRGLLSDDGDARWTGEQIELWLDGRRMTPLQKKATKKANRAFIFNDVEYTNIRSLAIALNGRPQQAIKAIRDGHLENWIRRGLEEEDMADTVAKYVAEAATFGSDPATVDDHLLARICLLLDHQAPVRYRQLSFMPDGLGPLMAFEYSHKGDAQSCADAIRREVPLLWFQAQHGFTTPLAGMRGVFSQLKGFIGIADPGYGVERCLYELNPSLHCLSPLIDEEHVIEVRGVLPALDNAAKKTDSKTKPVDRHIAAFVAARFSENVEQHLTAFASPEPHKSMIGMLSLLAMLQWRLDPKQTYLALTSWVGGQMGPALAIYHSRTTRREIEREIPKLVRKGSLPEIFNVLDNAQRRDADMRAFHAAQAEFAEAEAEVGKLEKSTPESAENVKVGNQAAAMFSMMVALTIVSIYVLLEYW